MDAKTKILSAVKRGSRLLDERHPGWRKKINLKKFDMDICPRCVIGQLFKCRSFVDFDNAIETLGLTPGTSHHYGFDLDYLTQSNPSELVNYWQAAWLKEITG